MFGDSKRTIVVVGAQWGDEGKGKLVDVMAERAAWVVRYQGGANAGHTVDLGDSTFVLHQIPSGILHEGVRCAIGNGVVLDPDQLFVEIDGLVRDGVDVEGRLYVSDRAHLVLPYHKLVDSESTASKEIGTTGRGIGPAYEDKVARRGVRVLDLKNRERLEKLVTQGAEHAIAQLRRFGSSKQVSVGETIDLLGRLEERLLPLAEDVGLVIHRAIKSGAAVLLEGAQGSLLDVDHGTYPYVTSSNCSSLGLFTGSGAPPQTVQNYVGIMKAYSTRVGGGPFPTEQANDIGTYIRERGNEYGTVTGRPRRVGWFDAVAVRYTATLAGADEITVMLLDVLSGHPELKLCTAYRVGGEERTHFPSDSFELEQCAPVFETMPGWSEDISKCRRLADRPAAARRYVDRIGELAGLPVSVVSVGPDRDQTIHLK